MCKYHIGYTHSITKLIARMIIIL